jgi:predicted nucleic acid-binding protein
MRRFFAWVDAGDVPLYLSVVTVGELRHGIEQLRRRGDAVQAGQLEAWLQRILTEYNDCILAFTVFLLLKKKQPNSGVGSERHTRSMRWISRLPPRL